MKYTEMQSIISHYRRGEGPRHWFERDTMRAFRSRLPEIAYTTDDLGTTYFVTSERFDRTSPRFYTVREYTWATRNIRNVGRFQEFASRDSAVYRAKAYASGRCAVPGGRVGGFVATEVSS